MDDIPPYQGELYIGLVLSDHAHARITVDTGPALAMEGVVDYVGVEDVPGTNVVGKGGRGRGGEGGKDWLATGTSMSMGGLI